MSGLALAQALDADEATRDIPRVALSADAMPDRQLVLPGGHGVATGEPAGQ